MNLLCDVCDRSIIENQSECNNYIVILRKKNDKSFDKKYSINNVNLNEVNKIVNDYITTRDKIFF